jgi:hypothetical protein
MSNSRQICSSVYDPGMVISGLKSNFVNADYVAIRSDSLIYLVLSAVVVVVFTSLIKYCQNRYGGDCPVAKK